MREINTVKSAWSITLAFSCGRCKRNCGSGRWRFPLWRYYNTQRMLTQVAHQGEVGLCGTDMDARGMAETEMLEGAQRSTLAQPAEWMAAADKVLAF